MLFVIQSGENRNWDKKTPLNYNFLKLFGSALTTGSKLFFIFQGLVIGNDIGNIVTKANLRPHLKLENIIEEKFMQKAEEEINTCTLPLTLDQ